MTVYCIELKNGSTWALKDIAHAKIPTQDKANTRMAELISEGQDASTIRAVSYTHLTLPTIYSV